MISKVSFLSWFYPKACLSPSNFFTINVWRCHVLVDIDSVNIIRLNDCAGQEGLLVEQACKCSVHCRNCIEAQKHQSENVNMTTKDAIFVLEDRALQLTVAMCLAKFVRGKEGVLFTVGFICAHYEVFVSDFRAFVEILYDEAWELCNNMGDMTYLAHKEGFHTGLSGLQFISALRLRHNCKRFMGASHQIRDVLFRFWEHGGRAAALTAFEFIQLGAAVDRQVTLAVHCGKNVRVGNYNTMETARCVELMIRFVLNGRPLVYDQQAGLVYFCQTLAYHSFRISSYRFH